MNKETETTKINNQTAEKMQLIVQEYFKNVLGLPCPDFTINLKNATKPNSKELKEQAHKEFNERFGDEFNNIYGNQKIVRTGEKIENINNFIDTIIDKTVEMTEDRICKEIIATAIRFQRPKPLITNNSDINN